MKTQTGNTISISLDAIKKTRAGHPSEPHGKSGQEKGMDKVTPENKCGFCTNSKCCTYITQSIQTPRSKTDFDHLLWQISHENIQIYKDDDGWYLLVNNKCTHLQPDGRCGIYETRPQICRDYSNDFCEYDQPAEEGFDLFFKDYDALLKYCRKRFRNWQRRVKD